MFRGTVVEATDFDPSADAETLYNAMKGIGELPHSSVFFDCGGTVRLSIHPLFGAMTKQRISPRRSDNNAIGDQFLICA